MDDIYESMLAAACLIAIVMSIGTAGTLFLVTWWKCRLTQLRKTKTDHTA